MDERGLVWRGSSTSNGGGVVERPPSTPSCPRCGSSNTKFCYYNNYSLSQPRFFCKSCRRYWTKGGSLRNVPVGGGSRKSRNHRRSSSLPPAAISNRHSFHHHHILNNNTTSIINTRSSSHGTTPAVDGSHIDLAIVYANFLNTTTSAAALINSNVDPVGCDIISSSSAAAATFPAAADGHDPMMQYYCGPEGRGLDSWTASNELPLLPRAEDQYVSLFHVASSSLPSDPHHQQQQDELQLQPPPDHGYNDLMMMFGNPSWSSFEFSGHLAADLNLK